MVGWGCSVQPEQNRSFGWVGCRGWAEEPDDCSHIQGQPALLSFLFLSLNLMFHLLSYTWLLAACQLPELCTGTRPSLAFGLWNTIRGVWDHCPMESGELGLERKVSHISLLVASPPNKSACKPEQPRSAALVWMVMQSAVWWLLWEIRVGLCVLGLLQEAAATEQTERKELKQGKVGLTLFICACVPL